MSNTVNKFFDVHLDICHNGSTPAFTVVQGDTGNILKIHLTDSGTPINLTDCFIQAVFLRGDGKTSTQSNNSYGVNVVGIGEIEIELYPSSVSPGTVECEIQVFSDESASTLVTSSKFTFDCRKSLFDDSTVPASPEFPLLTSLISEVKITGDKAEAAASSAAFAADNASFAAKQCSDALSSIPSDLTPAFLKTLTGTNIAFNDAQKGSKIQNCTVYGSCNVTRPDENLPVSAENINTISVSAPTSVNFSYHDNLESYTFQDVELAGIPNYAADTFDLISGTVTYNIARANFNGSESWYTVSGKNGYPSYYAAPLSLKGINYSPLICSHFPSILYEFAESVEPSNNIKGCCIMQGEIRIRPNDGEYETLDELVSALKSWQAAGTPLTVYYQLLYPSYSNIGSRNIVIPATFSSLGVDISTNILSNMEVTYCCDMNIFMNKAPIGTILRRTSRSDLGFSWEKLTYSDVNAAAASHGHGNISSGGAIGKTANSAVFTGENGVLAAIDASEARTLLDVPSTHEISSLKQRIPYVLKRIKSANPTLSNIQAEHGIISLKICGFWSIAKESDDADISPSNIANIAFFRPSLLLLTHSDNRITTVPFVEMPVLRGLNFCHDTFNVFTGELRIKISRLEMTGDEDWSLVDADAPYFSMSLASLDTAAAALAESACTHFESVPYANREAISTANTITGCSVHDDVLCIRPPNIDDYPDLDSFKAFLKSEYENSTPVTVYYEKYAEDIMGCSPTEFSAAFVKSLKADVPCFIDIEFAVDATQISKIDESAFGWDKTLTALKDGCEYHLGKLEKLTITQDALPADHYSILLYFDSCDSISVSVPASIRWAGGTAPEFSPNKTYEVSIKDGLGKVEVYDLADV